MITLEEVKEYARIDTDCDDRLLNDLIVAAVQYLKNATGGTYPEYDATGNKADYTLEKIYLQLLVSYWYENRSLMGRTGGVFNNMTKSLMLQLKMRQEADIWT